MDINERVLDKLEKIDDRLNNIDVKQAEMKVDLSHHMSRTEAVEETNELLKRHIDEQADNLSTRVTKLERWYDKFHYLGWLILAILGFVEKLDKIKLIFHAFF